MKPKFVCKACGGDNFVAWYPVDERQGICDLEMGADGVLTYDYDGCTKTGEAGPDDEYVCMDCQASGPSLESLVILSPK